MNAPTTFPADFEITPAMRTWARAQGMHPRHGFIEEQTEAFALYYVGSDDTATDWTTRWAEWLLSAWSQHTHARNARGWCACGRRYFPREEA